MRLAIVLAAAVALRWVALGNPIVHVDEEFYLLVARRMLGGALPYVDVWDRKSLALFVLYLPAALAGPVWGVLAYQLIALAAVVATAMMIARLAERAGWGGGATLVALLYVAWLGIADGQGGQAPVFYNALVAGAALLAGRPTAGVPWRGGVAAMALMGLALQVKYTCVFEGAWFGLWLLGRAWRAGARGGRLVAFAAVLMAVAAAPTLAAFGLYAALGHGDAWLFANFTSILARSSDPVGETLQNLLMLLASLAPLLLASVLGATRLGPGGDRMQGWLLRGWLIAAMVGVLAFGSWFNHYALPAMAPAAACAAALFARGGWQRAAGVVMLIAGAIASQQVGWSMREKRGTPAQFAAVTQAIAAQPPGCLFVYSDHPAHYTASPRCTVTRYLFPSHLTLGREAGSIGVDQRAEIARIFAQRPAVVVMRPFYGAYGELPAVRRLAEALLARNGYTLRATLPLGHDPVFVYAAPAASSRAS